MQINKSEGKMQFMFLRGYYIMERYRGVAPSRTEFITLPIQSGSICSRRIEKYTDGSRALDAIANELQLRNIWLSLGRAVACVAK